jgi:dihydroxyacetone kinase phosphoprotein-dependent L subunit
MNAGEIVRQCMHRALVAIQASEEELGRLDAAAGDGDHGATMVRGLTAANAALAESSGDAAGELLCQAGGAFADAAGGASGALIGAFLFSAGQTLRSGPYDAASVHGALNAGLDALCRLGKAKPGDKTMVDTLAPFVASLGQSVSETTPLAIAWQQALIAAADGAQSTTNMVARRGRAARLGVRSLGHPDPGAMSLLMMLKTAGDVLNEEQKSEVGSGISDDLSTSDFQYLETDHEF